MDWQPGHEDGEGAGRDRDPEPPPPSPPRRDPRLAMFARDGDDSWQPPTPSGRLALLIDELTGPDGRCPGATPDEQIGLLQTWAALESWAAGRKLAQIRQIMRAEAPPSPGAGHGDLPETWSRSLRYELSGALACSTQSAETTASLAWQLGARLPRTATALDNGTITSPKAKAITEIFTQLTDPDAAAAEAMIADQLAGKTYTQVLRLAEQAALTVDPGLAERWRDTPRRTTRASPSSASRPAPPACPAATCPPTRPSPPWPTSTPAPTNTKNPTRSTTPRWTSCAPTPTSTSSTK